MNSSGSQLFRSLDEVTLSLDHNLVTASESEPRAGLDHEVAGHGGEVLLDGGDQGGLGGVRTSVGMCLNIAPDEIVHWN